MAGRIPDKHREVVVEFLTQLFTGNFPGADPTDQYPIPVRKLYEAIWKRTGWGKPPEEEAKKSNGAWGNVRTAIKDMLENTEVIIISNGNSEHAPTGYYRPTRPEHFDQAYTTAMKLAQTYEEKARRLLNAKKKMFPDSPIKTDYSTMPKLGIFEDLFG